MRVSGTVHSNIGQCLHRDRRTAKHLAAHVAFSCSLPDVVVVVDGGYARESALCGAPALGKGVLGSAGSENALVLRRSLVGGAFDQTPPSLSAPTLA